MSRATQGVNADWVDIIESLRDEYEKGDGHSWDNYNRAARELKKHPERIHNAQDLEQVKFIGKSITGAVAKYQKKQSRDADSPGPSTKRKSSAGKKNATPVVESSRPKKRRRNVDNDDDMEDFSEAIRAIGQPPAKRRSTGEPSNPMASGSGANRPPVDFSRWGVPMPGLGYAVPPEFPNVVPPAASQHLPPPAQPSTPTPQNLQFWYIDERNKRVKTIEQAYVEFHNSAVYFKIEFPREQAGHPWIVNGSEGRTRGSDNFTYYASLKDAYAETLPTCPGFPTTSTADQIRQDAALATLLSSEGDPITTPKRSRPAVKPAPIPLSQRNSTVGGPSNQVLQSEFAKQAKKGASLGSIDPSRVPTLEVLNALANMRAGSSSGAGRNRADKPVVAAASTSVLASGSGSGSGSVKTETEMRRERMAAAALSRRVSDVFGDGSSSVAGSSSPARPEVYSRASTSTQRQPLASAANLPAIARMPSSSQPSATFKAPINAPASSSQPLPLRRNATAPVITRGPRVDSHMQAPRAIDELEYELEDSQPRARPSSPEPFDPYHPGRQNKHYTEPFEPHVFPAGSYNIVMILDNREVKSQKDRDAIRDQLEAKGVNVETRALSVGDVTWVAIRKYPDGVGNGQGGVIPQECVLDILLERKRMDDLCTSIKDSRFHEQKFRLKQSGIAQVYYLVEHYNTVEQRAKMDAAIDTALSSTQVVDGFMVKETKSLKDTVAYLATMHQTILKLYKNKPLYVIPHERIHRNDYLDLQRHLRSTQPARAYMIDYNDFHHLNLKSSFMTLKDCWARMLLRVNGLSAEKVAQILTLYETPADLWGAFLDAEQREEEEREREAMEDENAGVGGRAKGKGKGKKKSKVVLAKHMLTHVLPGEGRKKLGVALSEKVYTLFRAESY